MTTNHQPLTQHPAVQAVAQLASALGGRAYLVGGCVRDYLHRQHLNDDLDFCLIDVPALAVAQAVERQLNGRLVPLDPERGIHRVVLFDEAGQPGLTLDLSDALNNDLSTDLHRRDLTINALALDPLTGQVHDTTGGLTDLQSATLRMVSEANLCDDPLRLLRVFRFAAQLPAFTIEPQTLAVVTKHAALLPTVAGERIAVEWLKLLSVPVAFPVVQAMGQCGLLEVMTPELTAIRPVPPNTHHHLPLWEHTLELLNQLDEWLPQLPPWVQATLAQPMAGGAANELALVRLGCLLHDIAKPATWTIDPDGLRHRFIGHEAMGETMCGPILHRWKLSNELTKTIKHLVRWHLYPCQFGPDSSRKSVLRFFRRMGDLTPHVVVVALVDRLATRGPALSGEGALGKDIAAHFWLLEEYHGLINTLKAPPLLTGHDVMNLFPDRGAGAWIRVCLEAVQEAQQLGHCTTAQEAMAFLQQRHYPPTH
jgi:poly(A) polymerase